MMNPKDQHIIEAAIKQAYDDEGFQAALEVADKHNLKTEYCRACDNQVPVWDKEHECIICGQPTGKDPNDEIIPLENE